MAEREIILASASPTRARLLEAASVTFRVVPSEVDEQVIREQLSADNEEIDPADIAEVLARAKAEDVSRRYPEAIVVGGDQVLALGREIFAKAATVDEARDVLMKLRGQTHQLHSAVAIAEAGDVTWADIDTASVTMRKYSATALSQYLLIAGVRALESVGAYQIEGPGVVLFERIDGDHFTVMGMPLLPLLAELRDRKVLST